MPFGPTTAIAAPATMARTLSSMVRRGFVAAGRQAARSRMAASMAVVFITGPVRSGKSAFGVRLARESGYAVTYVATAAGEFEDVEWRARLTRHVRDRPASWRTVETATMTDDAQLALFRFAASAIARSIRSVARCWVPSSSSAFAFLSRGGLCASTAASTSATSLAIL